MGRFSGVLVASDFDGTLKNDDGVITDEVRAALRYFTENGGYFTVSTGRCFQGFHAYSPDIINAPAILANGGMLYDYAAKKVVRCDGIGQEGIPAIRDIRDMFPNSSIEMYPFDDTYAIHINENTVRHFTSFDIEYKIVEDPAGIPLPWAKVMINSRPEDTLRIQSFLAEKHPEIGFIPTDGSFLEVLGAGTNKGTAVLKLAEYLGVKREDIYTVGDGYNDVDMLKVAAEAFVPENGDSGALACATHILPSNNEHAVAALVEYLDKKYA